MDINKVGLSITDYVRIYENSFEENILNKLYRYSKDKPDFSNFSQSMITNKGKSQKDYVSEIRTSTTEIFNSFNPDPNHSITSVVLCNYLIKYFNFFGKKYIESVSPNNKFDFRINQIELLRYKENSKFESHIDYSIGGSRTLSFIYHINDDYLGGELIFENPMDRTNRIILKPQKNSLTIFPSNFMYPHTVCPVTSGERFTVVAWAI